MKIKKAVIGCDHAGFSLKDRVLPYLKEKYPETEFCDVGAYSAERCDYPIIASALCDKIASGDAELGILICGTGVGMSMAANKHKGIRAACCSDTYSARLTRMHNDANVLCFGERVVGFGLACDLADVFLTTDFEGGKHAVRVDMIMEIERKNQNG